MINYPGIGFIGSYKDSKPFGTFWAGMIAGRLRNAFLHGTTNETNGIITGNNIAYIYPDMETVYLGAFENRKMIDAQEAKIEKLGCDKSGMMFVKEYLKPSISVPHVYYEPATNVSFGKGPEGVMDPYEQKMFNYKRPRIKRWAKESTPKEISRMKSLLQCTMDSSLNTKVRNLICTRNDVE